MPIMQMPDDLAHELAHIPEVGMGMQAALIDDTAVLVVGGEIVILPDKEAAKQLEKLTERRWMRDTQNHEAQISDFNAWRSSLPVAHNLTLPPQQPTKVLLGFICLGPIGPLPKAPIAPPAVYGHLQFHGVTQPTIFFIGTSHFLRAEGSIRQPAQSLLIHSPRPSPNRTSRHQAFLPSRDSRFRPCYPPDGVGS